VLFMIAPYSDAEHRSNYLTRNRPAAAPRASSAHDAADPGVA
jgi:hypothetical protein